MRIGMLRGGLWGLRVFRLVMNGELAWLVVFLTSGLGVMLMVSFTSVTRTKLVCRVFIFVCFDEVWPDTAEYMSMRTLCRSIWNTVPA